MNRLKTTILLGGLTGLVIAVGYYFGGQNGALVALVLSAIANIPKPKLYLVSLPIPNAFATGRNEKHAVVAVTSGILQLLNENELRGVLAP